MNPICKIEFTAELVRESTMFGVTPIGEKKCSMKLWTSDGSFKEGHGSIEWLVGIKGEGNEMEWEEKVDIGVYWNCEKELTEYDNVFSLPVEAIKLLRKAGIKVSKDFEKD